MAAIKLKRKFFRRDVASKRKMTYKTRVIMMMLMGNFPIWIIIIMMALFFRKLLRNMFIAVYRLEQYRKQYYQSQRNTCYELSFFHYWQRYKRRYKKV